MFTLFVRRKMKNSNKARCSESNGRYKGLPQRYVHLVVSGHLIGLSPYVLSVRIRVHYGERVSPNRVRNYLRDSGINWREWKENGLRNT